MDELAKKFAQLTDQYGPNVVEAARTAARTEAYSSLSSSIICVLFAVVMYLTGRYLYTAEFNEDAEDFARPAGFVIAALALLPASIALWCWIDPWTWTAIINPDAYIAYKVFKL